MSLNTLKIILIEKELKLHFLALLWRQFFVDSLLQYFIALNVSSVLKFAQYRMNVVLGTMIVIYFLVLHCNVYTSPF